MLSGAQARRSLLRAWLRFMRRAERASCLWHALSYGNGARRSSVLGIRGVVLSLGLILGIAAVADAQPILTDAQFKGPVTHYPHGVLGDRIEYSAMVLQDSRGRSHRIDLPVGGAVFEDLAPRLWDVTGDGLPEAVVVESDPQAGAQLAIYGLRGGTLHKIAATPHIGTRFRWLAPVAAVDLDGDGHIEIAYIDRPHLAKTLRVWRYQNGALQEVAQQTGLTNHRIGEDFITSGLRDCGAGPELITVDADWTRIMATSLVDGRLISRDIGAFSHRDQLATRLYCVDPA
ncbi:FG-GAP repeat domain-containing protein [Phaeobacter gallaeciensis]|uniref:Repeat protein domain protein in Vibrio, Colwellia, Bradyrhizobium and Shewanella n=1 Tax=Phaeobacter gallaeciensis TaxID=60890 RepID=A0AAC9Z7P9_9RHOB|nr:VCBS repeat-containing protein [Phaeobacter gallaeciensis]AHD08799.1 Repeat protein domain protein in Vibrio, Colwellia, Bradyrhizobium and Shewanella [Phaeobacter gallaeciensis DSM 26640]ATE92065.1 Repeat protein domain protein in Vibrio, Colwellia, Bradyrhizobium and Shewanella [Phaeobacter gallaeciensis]ATE98111.1 Repeat protein domain protein in Vibrio, Colwellia, Bradyrhizobium and Shewanella [Phaeobacter gallaeciensis]ATF00681.1 Repeat protein domain protein in Vibrio, Colwellia, Brady